MAHYAKLDSNNVVMAVVAVDTINCMTRGGIEKEEIGVEHLIKSTGYNLWKKCSYNTSEGVHKEGGTPFRANYPGFGWIYNPEHDIFHLSQPYPSWSLNTTTGLWESPIGPAPELTTEQVMSGSRYEWDESTYTLDNTKGWVLVTQEDPADDIS